MNLSGFTRRQRRVILVMVLTVVMVLGLLAGFVITWLDRLESAATVPSPAPTASPPPSPSPSPFPSPAASATPPPDEGLWQKVRIARLFDQIAHQVEKERSLAPRSKVALAILDADDMLEALDALSTDADPPLAKPGDALFGLLPLPPACSWAQAPPSIYVEQQGQLYVNLDDVQEDPQHQAVLAHAYAHALQDQHFDLRRLAEKAQTTDQRLALRALLEGDALLTSALYINPELSAPDWDSLAQSLLGTETPACGRASPTEEVWSRLERFPYHEGRLFVEAHYKEGGWDSVSQAYAQAPLSTQEVLHPDRHPILDNSDGRRVRPATVSVPDLGTVLEDEWHLTLTDTLGEFVTGLVLGEDGDRDDAWNDASTIASGWEGDTLVLWQREDGTRLAVWRSLWANAEDASAFEVALMLRIPQRSTLLWPIPHGHDLPGRWWGIPDGAVHLRRTGRHVLLIQAADVMTLLAVAEELP